MWYFCTLILVYRTDVVCDAAHESSGFLRNKNLRWDENPCCGNIYRCIKVPPTHTPLSLLFALALPNALTNIKSDRRRRSVNGRSPENQVQSLCQFYWLKLHWVKEASLTPQREIYSTCHQDTKATLKRILLLPCSTLVGFRRLASLVKKVRK